MKVIDKLKALFLKHREVISYLFFGGLTTLVNWACSLILYELLGVPTIPTTAIAWVLSVTFAYFTNRKWVFTSRATEKSAMIKEAASFFWARVFSFVMDLLIMWSLVDLLGLPFAVVKLFSQVFVVVMNYFASKYIIFVKR